MKMIVFLILLILLILSITLDQHAPTFLDFTHRLSYLSVYLFSANDSFVRTFDHRSINA